MLQSEIRTGGDNLNQRIKQVRRSLDLTQQEFAVRIGMKQNSIALIESGKRNISNQAILAICREFDVNETWLRTGEGEMFLPKDPDDELSEFMGAVLREDIRTSVRKQLVDLIAHLPPDVLHAIAQVAGERAALYRETLPPNNKEG